MNFLDESEIIKSVTDDHHGIWAEKYRPKKLEDYIGNDMLKASIARYIKNNDLPHILLYSKSPGTGKTSAGKMIVNSIVCDYLYINASDESSVENIRTKVKGFASTLGLRGLKVVFLDEADFISLEGQAALRNLMETYSKKTRFILTCNYVEKILTAISSRCQTFEVVPPSKKDIAVHLAKILKEENVKYSPPDVALLVNSYYPDMRKMIGTAQQNSFEGKLTLDNNKTIESEGKLKLIDLLKTKSDQKTKFKSIRQLVADSETSDFTSWYSYLYEKIDDYATGHIVGVIAIIAEAAYRDAFAIDKELQFADCVAKLVNELEG